jgi:2-iminobutanoate/2-iminopropanoate deaminase
MTRRALPILMAFAAGLFVHPLLTAQSSGRRVIRPERVPQIGLPFSPAILVGDTMYLAGQLGRDPKTTALVPGGIGGMDFGDVATVTAFIVDFKEFDTFNRVYREHFPRDPPARATVAVAALNQGARVELQMIAVKSR